MARNRSTAVRACSARAAAPGGRSPSSTRIWRSWTTSPYRSRKASAGSSIRSRPRAGLLGRAGPLGHRGHGRVLVTPLDQQLGHRVQDDLPVGVAAAGGRAPPPLPGACPCARHRSFLFPAAVRRPPPDPGEVDHRHRAGGRVLLGLPRAGDPRPRARRGPCLRGSHAGHQRHRAQLGSSPSGSSGPWSLAPPPWRCTPAAGAPPPPGCWPPG
jgi:hypothetical protein